MNLKFKAAEFQCFNWLYKHAPCFPVDGSKVNIINDPRKFYDTLCERFKNANNRISIASLYIGTGSLEKRLFEETKENVLRKNELKFKVLLDFQRGTRGTVNSVSLLKDFVYNAPKYSDIYLYQTPRLHGSWSKALPSRYNEIIGLQHMKLYIADDSVLLSGANCSNDYFERRQDRYIEIQDQDLADFYTELIDEICSISKKCDENGIRDLEYKEPRKVLVKSVNEKIRSFIDKWKDKQASSSTINDTKDTWIFPLLQMGEFMIDQDEQATQRFLTTVPKESTVKLATGYFNLTEQYAKTILLSCKSNVSLLMAHPNANGFMGAAGPAGGIPHAYSLIARKFWQKVEETNQTNRIQLLEYERDGWTFHAKGLWYYPPRSALPWATLVGSANLGERSVRRDLEAQAAILTVSSDLQKRLHEESVLLHKYSSECSSLLQRRRTPLWVRATVGLFRTYF